MAERKTGAGQAGQSIQEWISFAGWITMFLIGPATPQLLEHLRAGEDFQVVYDGPVYFSDHAAYSLEIQNNGRAARHNVEIWAPLPPGGDVLLAQSPYDYSAPRQVQSRDVEGHRVLNLGEMKPGERYTVGIKTTWKPNAEPQPSYAAIPWVVARVVSAEKTAAATGWRFRAFRDEMNLRWYRDAFASMSAAVVLLLLVLTEKGRQAAQPAPVKVPLPKEAWRRPSQLSATAFSQERP